MSGDVEGDLKLAELVARGPSFAARFAAEECQPSRRVWESVPSVQAATALFLVEHHRLPVEDLGPEVLRDWVMLTGACLRDVLEQERRQELSARGETDPAALRPVPQKWIQQAQTRREFFPYLTARADALFWAAVHSGIAEQSPPLPELPRLLSWLLRENRTDRARARAYVLASLDAAQRPGDRLVWLQLLAGTDPGQLALSDAELLQAAAQLAGVISIGEGQIVETLVPRLIAIVPEQDLPDVAVPGLVARTKKAQRAVLAALLARPRPEAGIARDVASAVEPLVEGSGPLASAAATLLAAWGLDAPPPRQPERGSRGRWRPTPDVWTPPPLREGPASVQRLTELAGMLHHRQRFGGDAITERFLADLVELAHTDPAVPLSGLRGFARSEVSELRELTELATGRASPLAVWRPEPDVVNERNRAVIQGLGRVPLLLSTPSTVDLSITAADLLANLDLYQRKGLSAEPNDVMMALTRLNPATVGAAEHAALEASAVLVDSGDAQIAMRVGERALHYLEDPVQEPPLVPHAGYERLWPGHATWPESLRGFPQTAPLLFAGTGHVVGSLFPRWSDAVTATSGYSSTWEMVPLWEQAVRRATPLSPGTASNLVALARLAPGSRAAELGQALDDAWSRGLLRPGAFDLALIDWLPHGRASLAALSRVLLDVAERGAAAYSWGFLDALLLDSAGASRLYPGTAQLADAMADLAPDAAEAVRAGLVGPEALRVPGLRAVAAKGGSAAAVRAAREAVAVLVEVSAEVSGASDGG